MAAIAWCPSFAVCVDCKAVMGSYMFGTLNPADYVVRCWPRSLVRDYITRFPIVKLAVPSGSGLTLNLWPGLRGRLSPFIAT